jgi:thiamine-monophosphate kinase
MPQHERSLLSAIRAQAAQSSGRVRVGIGDDAAVVALRSGEELVVTTDLSIEEVHFRRDWHPPEAVGHKCLARGLSDVAAMGARPIASFLSLALPPELTRPGRQGTRSWLDRFYQGLLALAARARAPLAGGDLAQSPGPNGKAAADIVVLGAVPKGRALLRSTARPGDLLYVTGTLGGAAAEFRALQQRPARFRSVAANKAVHPHFFPEPRLAAGRQLMVRHLASAAIDISDGLSVDLLHLCEESGVSAEIAPAAIPLGPDATLNDALHGGDDYELLFTASPAQRIPARLGGVPLHCIGRMLRRRAGVSPMVLLEEGLRTPLQPAGWEHF